MEWRPSYLEHLNPFFLPTRTHSDPHSACAQWGRAREEQGGSSSSSSSPFDDILKRGVGIASDCYAGGRDRGGGKRRISFLPSFLPALCLPLSLPLIPICRLISANLRLGSRIRRLRTCHSHALAEKRGGRKHRAVRDFSSKSRNNHSFSFRS